MSGAAAILLACAVWGFWLEPRALVVRLTTLPLPGWPAEDANLRIALIGDLHTGSPWNGLDKLRTIVERSNAARPHLVLLLGDYLAWPPVGRHVSPEEIGAALGGLRAPLGIYAVLGNHDYGLNGPRVRGALGRAGITVLEDQAVRIGGGAGAPGADAPFWLVGVTDLERAPHDLLGALARVTDDAPVLLFMHNPDQFPEVPARVTLTIAAHTHGGQVRLPFVGRPIVPSIYGQRYAAGYVVEEGRRLFVNTGLGTSVIPIRFLVPPVVDILELRPEEKRPANRR